MSTQVCEEKPLHSYRQLSLPSEGGQLWVPGCAPPAGEFSIGVCSGPPRPGDIAGWMRHYRPQHTHLRIDHLIGGYEHVINRPHVTAALAELAALPNCVAVVLQLPCGPWSVVKFREGEGNLPKPIFTTEHPDGVPDREHSTTSALAVLQAGLHIASAALRHGAHVLSEHPIWQGTGSELPTRGLEQHSSMHRTTVSRAFAREHSMATVLTDQCMSGHENRKSTELLTSPALLPHVRRLLGSLRCNHRSGEHGDQLHGKEADGSYKTKKAGRYPSLFSQRIAAAIALAIADHPDPAASSGGADASPAAAGGESVPEGTACAAATGSSMPTEAGRSSCQFKVDDRVEVWWYQDKQWYAGIITDVDVGVRQLRNGSVKSPEVTIQYDDGITKVHSVQNTEIRLEHDMPSLHTLGVPQELELDDKPTTLVITDYWIDLESAEVVNTWTLCTVTNSTLEGKISSNDTLNARYWHTPINEREFQRSLWRTAQELKWDKYMHLHMFTWVPVSAVDQIKHRIYSTLWARKIKLNSDSTFNKLNPRWCLKGGTMDRDLFKSHAETLRMATFRTLLAIKGGYYLALCAFLLDCSDAFQSTRTDDSDDQPPLYCWPAPGFEQRNAQGERMVCHVHVGMQGRIDATRLFNARLFKLLIEKADMTACLWDGQLVIYDTTPHRGTDKALSETLEFLRTATDTEAQQPPLGYALIGWHVDDGTGVACSVGWDLDHSSNRVVRYLRGIIEVVYATTLTGWHGNKALGFTLSLNDKDRSVTLTAPDALEQLARDVTSGGMVIGPKHVMTEDFTDIPAGVLPATGDPTHAAVKEAMALCRHALGVLIWLSNAYMQAAMPTNTLCANMAAPHPELTLKAVRFLVMHLVKYPHGVRYGGHGVHGLEYDVERAEGSPYEGPKAMHLHWFSDANLHNARSVTGAVCMLAGGCILAVSQRQHLACPCSHTAEVVAAGTGYSMLCPIAGVLQEVRIALGIPVPFYLDSQSTVFVATSDTAIRKSAWLIRRAAVLTDAVRHGEIRPIHVNDPHMAADPFTKYKARDVWWKHMCYVLNVPVAS